MSKLNPSSKIELPVITLFLLSFAQDRLGQILVCMQ